MNIRSLHLAASALHWPARVVTAAELDARFGLPAGWTEERTGVVRRRFVEPGRDTNASMGAAAVRRVLDAAGLGFAEVDLLVNASGSIQQPIPCTAALIQRELGEAAAASGVPCLDLNATCLSFLFALEFAGSWLAARGAGHVLIVSSEIASQGVDWSDPHSACLFGDGAAACLLEHAPGAGSGLLASRFETFSEGSEHCEVRGGAQAHPPWTYAPERHQDFVFRMDGPAVHRLAAKRLPGLVERVLADAGLRMDELAAVVPHQAGITPMRLVERRLGLAPGQMVFTLAEHGNLIAASIPTALHLARESGRVRAGDRVLLLGTAAGYAQGAVVWQL
ncbi:MAG: beta-ketoacyl-ACP synthase III [Gluconacetobacter diazotrophicus]|nr:beta-ketoacyl-ACP synthase III [Gluconacetobacter diazotrophicus]